MKICINVLYVHLRVSQALIVGEIKLWSFKCENNEKTRIYQPGFIRAFLMKLWIWFSKFFNRLSKMKYQNRFSSDKSSKDFIFFLKNQSTDNRKSTIHRWATILGSSWHLMEKWAFLSYTHVHREDFIQIKISHLSSTIRG